MLHRVVLFRPPIQGVSGELLPASFFRRRRLLGRPKQLDVFKSKPDVDQVRRLLKDVVAAPPLEQSLKLIYSPKVGGMVEKTICWRFCSCTDGQFWCHPGVSAQAVPFTVAQDGSLAYPPEDPTFIGIFPHELEKAVEEYAKAA